MSDNANKMQNNLMDIKLWAAFGASLACILASWLLHYNQHVSTKFTTRNVMKVKVMETWVSHFLFS